MSKENIQTRICLSCGKRLDGRRDAKTCSPRCRKRLQRLAAKIEQPRAEALANQFAFANLQTSPSPSKQKVSDIISPDKITMATEPDELPDLDNNVNYQADPEGEQNSRTTRPLYEWVGALTAFVILLVLGGSLLSAFQRERYEPQLSFGQRWLRAVALRPVELKSRGPIGPRGPGGPAGKGGAGTIVGTTIQSGSGGVQGPAGADGAAGAPGDQGPQGPGGAGTCANGDCVSLQAASPGVQESGNIHIDGTIIAGFFQGDGSDLTNVDAETLDGLNSTYFTNASNISSGTLSDVRLSANVSLLGSSIQDSEVDDDLTISAAGSVNWLALTNYPSGCAAGEAVTTIGDTLTCSSFAPGSGSSNYIQNQTAVDQVASFRIDGTGRAGMAFQAPLFDTATAAALGIGNTNATSVSICNSAACDTVNIGTNADVDNLNLGDSLDTLTLTGAATSSFVLNGITVTAGEFNILDGGIDLGTETNGDYVATVSGGAGLTGSGSGEGSTPTLAVASGNGGIVVNADDITLTLTTSGTTGATSSNSGLEVGAGGLSLLKGCADNELLKWTDAGGWACATDDNTGSGSSNSFETINAPAGTDPVADSATDTLNLTVTGTNFTVTGTSGTDTIDFNIAESVLAGAGLAANGDALDVSAGNGIQITADAVALGPLSADWDQTGAFDIVLNNASSELRILESAGGTFYGTLDVGDLAVADATYTFSGTSGTVLTSANYTGTLDPVYVNVGESPAAGDISGSFSGGLTINANSVALGTDTTGDYVASFTAGAGLTGNATGEGSTPTLNVVSANGGIVANADNIALTLATSANGLSATTSSGSGLEILASGVTLLQGCDDGQILKWDETADVWACANDSSSGGSGSLQDAYDNGATITTADATDLVITLANTTTDSNLTVTTEAGGEGFTSLSLADGDNSTSPAQLLQIQNLDTGEALANGIVISSAGGAITDAIDVSDADIVNALNIGANNILTSGATISSAELDLLDGHGDGGSTLVDTNDAVNTAITGTGALNSGSITSGFGSIDVGAGDSIATNTLNGSTATTLTIGNATSTGVSICNSAACDTISIGTNADADAINIGDSLDTLTLTGNSSSAFVLNGVTVSAAEFNVLDGGIDLGTETNGDYVATVTGGAGLTGSGTGEGSTPTLAVASANGGIVVNADDIALTLASSADDLSATTSSGSGLEILSSGVTLLQGCGDTEILKWDETNDVWACASDGTGTASNSFETINAPAGTDPVADGPTDTLNLTVTGSNFSVTGTAGTDTLNFDISESTLAGAGLAANGDALDVSTGNGIQITADAVALGPLSADWDQTGAFDIVLNNASSELRILESAGGTFYGTLDVGDLAVADATYTFSGTSGTVLTSANYTGTLDPVYVNVGESPAAGDISGSFSGGLTINANSVALGTDTTGDYVASFTAGTGLTGDATGEGSTPTLNVVSANGGIVANADSIALTVAASANGLSATSSSGSGLEILASGVTLLQGCSDTQILKWDETADVWVCADDEDSASTVSLQDAYDAGNTIITADATDLAITLANTDTDSILTVTTEAGGEGFTSLSLADGDNSVTSPVQLLQIQNLDSDEALANGILVGSAAGSITDAIDVSDADIINALNIGDNNILTGSATISAAELNLLDGHDTALVDTNDAVNTAITGTGALNSGSITSGFGAIDVGADNISTTGTVSGNNIDRTSAGALTFGSTNATSVSVCNSAACDTINLGTNTDADAINIGDSLDTLTLTGNSSSTFLLDGVTVSAAEFNTLDGGIDLGSETNGDYVASFTAGAGLTGNATGEGSTPTIAVVSANGGIVANADNIALTVAASSNGLSATTSSGSGLEVLASGVTLLQGCSDGQVLKWDETADVWTCSADEDSASTVSLQDAYDAGNTITTADATDIAITLADTSDDANLTVTTAAAGEGFTSLSLADGDNFVTSPAQLLQIQNLDTDDALANGITIASAGGAITDAIDASDAAIVNALNIGSNNIVTGATTISSAELDRLDGHDAALVDVNDAVNTAITGTGALNAGSITSGFGSIDTGADNITTTGTVFGNNFDRSTAGALTFGDTNATSVSICNSAACDTISIGTNADADTINIGDSTDTLTIGSTINLQNAEQIDNTTNGRITFAGVGGTNPSSLILDLDGASGAVPTFFGGAAFIAFGNNTIFGLDGSSTESINEAGFALDGNDVYMEDMLGVNGNAYIDGTLDVDGAITFDNNLTIGGNSIITSGATISAAELNLLDGHDAALVDTNDAVNTAITGTGALNAGSITSGFGSIDTGADNITTTGTVQGSTSVLTSALDRVSAGALTIGNTTATSVSICNSADCDTIDIGTNADADTITIGNGTGATTVVIKCGTGDCLLGTNSTDHYTAIGSIAGTSITDINAGTGGIRIGGSNVAQTIQIGNSGSAAQTITLGANPNGAQTLTVGSTNTTSTTTINAGSGGLRLDSTAAITVGNTNATSVSICNSAACDTIDIGTNADADAINIGDSLDTVTINGGSGSSIVWNGVTISAAELALLDGHDAALVDTNDAVNTAITGTGALNSGSITSGFGSIDTGSDNISTTGTVNANDFTRSSAGALTFGNTNATSVSICNSAACDTIDIGTNADADAINIGDSLDTLTLTGASGSSFVLNGVTVSAAEFNILDGGIQDSEVDNDLTISSSGSVDWTALTNYPAACAAGSAVSTLADSPSCTAFNTDTSITLQDAYTAGGSITTADNKDIDLVLADTATDSNLDIDLIADNTVTISRNDGASSEAPAQLLKLENLDTDLTIADGINFNVAASGVITDAIDASDADIVNAINIGANKLLSTELDFDVAPTGSTSSISVATDNAAEDFTLEVTGATDSSLILSSSGTAADALQIKATAGGIDILASGAAAGEDIDIAATGSSVNISSTEAVSDAIKLLASDAAGQIFIDAGTTDKTADAVRFDVDVNSASVDGLYIDLDVGTALSAAEQISGINIDVTGLAGDDATSLLYGLNLNGDITSAGTVKALNLAGSWDTGLDLSGATTTTDLVLDDGLTIAQTSDNDVDLVENSLTLNYDFGETTASTITESSASALTYSSTGGALTLNATSAALTLQTTTSGDVAIKPAGNVTVGTSDTTGTLLVLDTKTGSGDPTGANGGMYYNSNDNAFRCYENSLWKNCIGTSGNAILGYAEKTANQTGITTITDITSLSTTVTVPSGHRIRISTIVQVSTNTNDTATSLYVRESSTKIQTCSIYNSNLFINENAPCDVIISPSAGSHTYKISLEFLNAGTRGVACSSTSLCYIMVEDIDAVNTDLETLDTVYENDSDKVLSVNDATGLIFDLTTTGDLLVKDNGSAAFATFDDSGGITFAPGSTSDVTFTLDDDSGITESGTLTSSGAILHQINVTLGNDNDADTVEGLVINPTSANTGDADNLIALLVNNVTSQQSSVGEYGLYIGTNYDFDQTFLDATPNILLAATDNTTDLTILDTSVNNLLEFKDLSTNFGAYAETGAFIDRNSYFGEEFNKFRTSSGTESSGIDGAGMGDGGGWGMYEGGTSADCTAGTTADEINGAVELVKATAVNGGCLLMVGEAAGNLRTILDADNLPTMIFKVKPGQADATSGIYIGMGDATDGAVTMPANFLGFSNNNAGTLGGTWVGRVQSNETSGGTDTVVCTGATITTSAYALLKVEVISASKVNFYADEDVSNGISWRSCGSATTENNIPDASLAPEIAWQELTGGSTTNSFLRTDFFRAWQDDTPAPRDVPQDTSTTQTTSTGQTDPLTMESAPSDYDGKTALADLMTASEDLEYDLGQRLDTQVLYASKGVVTPELTADKVETNSIESAAGTDIELKLGEGGKFVIAGANGENAITFDAAGNAQFAGTVTADKLKANQIEGLEVFTDKLSSLSEHLAGLETTQTGGDSSTDQSTQTTDPATNTSAPADFGKVTIKQATVELNLNVDGTLIASGGLKVGGPAEFHDTSVFFKLASFVDRVIFHNDVTFEGTATFNKDMGGFATVKAGQDHVQVAFSQLFNQLPVVTVSVRDGQFVDYAYKNLTPSGFTIVLKDPATTDVDFSWTALSIKNPQTSQAGAP